MERTEDIGSRVGMIIGEACRVVSSAPEYALGFVLIVGSVATVVDVSGAVGGGDFVVNVISFILGYFMTRAFIERSGLATTGLIGGIGVYFGVSILSGLAIGLGLLLLIVPGLVLVARWSPSYAIALADGQGVTGALGEAWDITEGHTVPLLITMVAPMVLIVAGGSLLYFAGDATLAVPLWAAIGANALLFSGTVAGTAVGIAAYSLLRNRDRHLEGVFE